MQVDGVGGSASAALKQNQAKHSRPYIRWTARGITMGIPMGSSTHDHGLPWKAIEDRGIAMGNHGIATDDNGIAMVFPWLIMALPWYFRE